MCWWMFAEMSTVSPSTGLLPIQVHLVAESGLCHIKLWSNQSINWLLTSLGVRLEANVSLVANGNGYGLDHQAVTRDMDNLVYYNIYLQAKAARRSAFLFADICYLRLRHGCTFCLKDGIRNHPCGLDSGICRLPCTVDPLWLLIFFKLLQSRFVFGLLHTTFMFLTVSEGAVLVH